jgi:hypothetical protein
MKAYPTGQIHVAAMKFSEDFTHSSSAYAEITDALAFHHVDHAILFGLPGKMQGQLTDFQSKLRGPWPSFAASRYNKKEAVVILSTWQILCLLAMPHDVEGVRNFNPRATVNTSYIAVLDSGKTVMDFALINCHWPEQGANIWRIQSNVEAVMMHRLGISVQNLEQKPEYAITPKGFNVVNRVEDRIARFGPDSFLEVLTLEQA